MSQILNEKSTEILNFINQSIVLFSIVHMF